MDLLFGEIEVGCRLQRCEMKYLQVLSGNVMEPGKKFPFIATLLRERARFFPHVMNILDCICSTNYWRSIHTFWNEIYSAPR